MPCSHHRAGQVRRWQQAGKQYSKMEMFLEKQAEISLHSWKLNQLPNSFYLMLRKGERKKNKTILKMLE